MNQVETILFNAIKTDNLVLFSKSIKGNESLCYGRFPLLSLCYLYKSKKIIKNYKRFILKLKFYTFAEEPYEIYDKFRLIAGRNMRLYLEESNIVSPIEMLAIMGEDRKVKSLYKEYNDLKIMTEKISKNLGKIYTISKQSTTISDKKITIGIKAMSGKQKMWFRLATIMCSCFIVLICSGFAYLNFSVGLGTKFNPYKISNLAQFNNAINASGYYTLTTDLTLSNDYSSINFKGNLDGNGHTLTIDKLPNGKLIDNSGTIKNLNISYGQHVADISSSLSLFVGDNSGVIDSVNITCASITLNGNKSASKDIHFSSFATKNLGTINNCKLELTGSATATGDGEFFVGGLVAINNGTISNCEFLKGEFSSKEVDIVGICTYNEYGASVLNCYNNVRLTQVSELDGWAPTIGGIVHSNYGTIKECINRAELSITSNNETENANGNIMLGGISANNYGEINKCLSNGKLNAISKKIVVYCGGISAYSSYWKNNNTAIYPSVINCGANCEIKFSVEHENGVAFVGGLFGFITGSVSDCYSLAKFSKAYNVDDKDFVGVFAGNAYLEYSFLTQYIDVSLNNNFVATNSNSNYLIGSLINSGSLVSAGVNVSQGIYTLSESDIKVAEVYFNE